MHDDMIAALDDESIQRLLVLAPRGWGKSTLVQKGWALKRLAYGDTRFYIPISCSAGQAKLISEGLKGEIEASPDLRKLFALEKDDGSWAKDLWRVRSELMNTDTLVMPRGSHQQVRGLLQSRFRPDTIVLDDVEDPESVRSEEQRLKLKQWFLSDVMNSVPQDRPWRIIVIGTILHEDCLLLNLKEDPAWTVVEMTIADENLKASWPEYMDDQKIAAVRKMCESQGQLDLFYQEYMNQPMSPEDATFKQDYFKHYEESERRRESSRWENILLVDPAKSVKPDSDPTAMVVVGCNWTTGDLFVRDVVNARLHPHEMYERALELAGHYGVSAIGVEVTSLNEFIVYPFMSAMRESGMLFNLVELKARGKTKLDRIKMLGPLYRSGRIWHNRAVCAALEGQLLAFPKSRHDDVSDALAYMIEMFEIGGRYHNLGDAGYTSEERYQELEKEAALPPVEDWSVA